MCSAPESVKASWMVESSADQIANSAKASGSRPEFLGEGSGNRAGVAPEGELAPAAALCGAASESVQAGCAGPNTALDNPKKTRVVTSFKGALEIKQLSLQLHTTGWYGSPAVIVPQVFRLAAMQREAAPRYSPWITSALGHKRPVSHSLTLA